MGRIRPAWQLLPHASDVRIRASGEDLAEAFGAAVAALAGVVTGGRPPSAQEERAFEVTGEDAASQLVALLAECLWRLEGEAWLACKAEVAFPAPDRCTGMLRGRPFDPARHGRGRAVKGATWHDLVVREDDAGAVVEVLLDL
ncbi:MAG: archease [Deltaproteobacteria bacterium]|nr:archease [Deltaproteobacteria bacterium]